MKRASLVVALCACNRVFELRETAHVDAARIDTPIDARITCPPIGTAPRFSPALTQVIAQACTDDTISVRPSACSTSITRPRALGSRPRSSWPASRPWSAEARRRLQPAALDSVFYVQQAAQ